MQRIEAIAICAGFGLLGVGAYAVLIWLGLPTDKAEIWTPVFLLGGLILWLATYAGRVVMGKMTYHQQLQNYQRAVLAKKLAELSPEEISQLLQED
jgi:hypothetical protein